MQLFSHAYLLFVYRITKNKLDENKKKASNNTHTIENAKERLNESSSKSTAQLSE